MSIFDIQKKTENALCQLLYQLDPNGNAKLEDLYKAFRPEREFPKGADRTPQNVARSLGVLLVALQKGDLSIQFEGEPQARKITCAENGNIALEPLPVAENPPYSGFSLWFMRLFHGINSSWFKAGLERQETYEKTNDMNNSRVARSLTDTEDYKSFAGKFSGIIESVNKTLEDNVILDLYNDRESGMQKYFVKAYDFGLNARNKPYLAPYACVYLLGQPLEAFDSDPEKALNKRRDLADRMFRGEPLTEAEIQRGRQLCDSEPKKADEGKQWRVLQRYEAAQAVKDYLSTCNKADNSFLCAAMTYELLCDTCTNTSNLQIISAYKGVTPEDMAYLKGTNAMCRAVGVGMTAERYLMKQAVGIAPVQEQYENAVACMMLGRAVQSYMRKEKSYLEGKKSLSDEDFAPNFAQRLFSAASLTPKQMEREFRKTDGFRKLMKLTPSDLATKLQDNGQEINKIILDSTNTLIGALATTYGIDLSGEKHEDAVTVYHPVEHGMSAEKTAKI